MREVIKSHLKIQIKSHLKIQPRGGGRGAQESTPRFSREEVGEVIKSQLHRFSREEVGEVLKSLLPDSAERRWER